MPLLNELEKRKWFYTIKSQYFINAFSIYICRAKARLVYACEWNPHAIEALRRNVEANSVSDRCIILEGDNRITAPKVRLMIFQTAHHLFNSMQMFQGIPVGSSKSLK